jgi:hypothetical protein
MVEEVWQRLDAEMRSKAMDCKGIRIKNACIGIATVKPAIPKIRPVIKKETYCDLCAKMKPSEEVRPFNLKMAGEVMPAHVCRQCEE